MKIDCVSDSSVARVREKRRETQVAYIYEIERNVTTQSLPSSFSSFFSFLLSFLPSSTHTFTVGPPGHPPPPFFPFSRLKRTSCSAKRRGACPVGVGGGWMRGGERREGRCVQRWLDWCVDRIGLLLSQSTRTAPPPPRKCNRPHATRPMHTYMDACIPGRSA